MTRLQSAALWLLELAALALTWVACAALAVVAGALTGGL
jgi:hypothetical protein